MTEEHFVGGAIRALGMWRIFYDGGNDLYYVVIKDLGLRPLSIVPLSIDLQAFVFNLALGTAMILATPMILHMLYDKGIEPQPWAKP